MANIATFKKSGPELQGEIVTLGRQTKGVRIISEANRSSDNARSHRIYVGRAERSAKRSRKRSPSPAAVAKSRPTSLAHVYARKLNECRSTG